MSDLSVFGMAAFLDFLNSVDAKTRKKAERMIVSGSNPIDVVHYLGQRGAKLSPKVLEEAERALKK